MKLNSKYFKRSEFACQDGCGFDTVDVTLLEVLESVREHFNAPVLITSGCRCKANNKAVGGAKNSQHLYGRAADFKVDGIGPEMVKAYLEAKFPGKLGIGIYKNRLHVDTRTDEPARWDARS